VAATAWVCRGTVCLPPVSSLRAVERLLGDDPAARRQPDGDANV
jgi:hypothetical protein